MYLLLHAVPLAGLLTAAPLLLQRGGEGELGVMAGQYILYMLPTVFFECINRWANDCLRGWAAMPCAGLCS